MNTRKHERQMLIRFLLAAVLLVVGQGIALAQHEQHGGNAHSTARLMPGLSTLHHPVSTKNPEAQKFFDQGLALIYAFNHEESARSFKRAAELDPQLAMAQWGIALAVGPNYNEPQIDPARLAAAENALETARALAGRATPKEQTLIAALSKRFQPKTDLKKCAVDYKDAMAAAYKRFPQDSDVAALYADSLMNLTPWQLWTKDGKPGEFTAEIVATLEAVLKRDPEHVGANHLYIHAVEASKTPGRALPSAGRLAKLAPNAGHLVHMPSHIYIRTGNYAAAAQSNEDAAEVDRAYIKATGVTGMYPAMYYSHNLHFALEAYNRMGNYAEAEQKARQLADNVRGHIKDMPMLEGFLPSVVFVQLRFNRWADVLKQPEPGKDMPVTNTLWHYARGVAFAAQGKLAEAQQERERFAAMAKDLPGDTPFGLNTAASVMKIATQVLDARLAAAQGNRQAAVEHWQKAVAAQDELNYDEPPGWYYPVRESLGAAMLLAGDAKGAEQVFRRDLEENPNNPRSLFGLAESLQKQRKTQAAQQAKRAFATAWKRADTKLRIEDL